MKSHESEIQSGERFQFGKNWKAFLSVLDEERIDEAQRSLRELLQLDDFTGKAFLDVGSGSGLFSLAARRLGARIHSFDYDPSSVECTRELRRRHYPDDERWAIEEGSALDRSYVDSLGEFDIVYAWGVLHHTGDMWTALEYAHRPVKRDGLYAIFIYPDMGWKSVAWRKIKQTYCSGWPGRTLVTTLFVPYFFLRALVEDTVRLKNPRRRYAEYKKRRGMSIFYDWIDWLGGYPYEVANTDRLIAFYEQRGFELANQKGNQLVFRRVANQRATDS